MRETLIVGAGASLGAAVRYGLITALGAGLWPLLLINVLGSAAMGALRPGKFLGTGVLGGFTSFASFAFLTHDLNPWGALGYVIATVVGCIGAYLLGDKLR